MITVTYAPDVVEEAVLLAERTAARPDAREFRRTLDRAYLVADPGRREAAFQDVHREWFARLGLRGGIEEALAERQDLSRLVSECRVLAARRPCDEGADLFDRAVPMWEADRRPLLIIRVRPSTLFDRPGLVRLLRHELLHTSDMLDPAFGYKRTLPASDDGPSADNILRDRYRALWDVVIDGRLARQGFSCPDTRAARYREFAQAFPMLGSDTGRLFDEWFDTVEPTHDRIVEFAMRPPAAAPHGYEGRCPLCRFPVASLDPSPERLSPAGRQRIERQHPQWRIEQGLCAQCLDLYEAQP